MPGNCKGRFMWQDGVKTENESIYYNIDTIHRAIQENRQIAFLYMDWNLKRK